MIIVSDTSPIANLITIDQLEILQKVFKKVIVPPAVDKEIRDLEQFHYNLQEYKTCKWIQIQVPSNTRRG